MLLDRERGRLEMALCGCSYSALFLDPSELIAGGGKR